MKKVEHGYSLIIEFKKDSSISFEIIYHTVENKMITQISQNESLIDFQTLNNRLESRVYDNIIDSVYADAYEKICYPYYASVFNAVINGDGVYNKIKKIIKQLFFQKRNQDKREILLLHLTRNETYRYITEKALKDKLNC